MRFLLGFAVIAAFFGLIAGSLFRDYSAAQELRTPVQSGAPEIEEAPAVAVQSSGTPAAQGPAGDPPMNAPVEFHGPVGPPHMIGPTAPPPSY